MDELAVLEVEHHEGVGVLRLSGEVDVSNVDAMTSQLASALGGVRRGVIDLSGLAYVDSAGVGMLITVAAEAHARGAPLHIVLPQEAPIERILTIVDLPRLAVFHDSVADALALP
jgi:anti-anti-sigma factor